MDGEEALESSHSPDVIFKSPQLVSEVFSRCFIVKPISSGIAHNNPMCIGAITIYIIEI
tara:strand:+ start:157 stop:333 length:177 start_codon:yes stop_codon:yes gene_type:complete